MVITTSRAQLSDVEFTEPDRFVKDEKTFMAQDHAHLSQAIAKTSENHTVVTVSDTINTKEKVLDILERADAQALDMEIHWIYKTARETPSPDGPRVMLPAFKGVSDEGIEEQRDGVMGRKALENAAYTMLRFFHQYVEAPKRAQ
eukprot:m51a1_g13732 hypothetical protein (145) ;mRNA; r:142118-142552